MAAVGEMREVDGMYGRTGGASPAARQPVRPPSARPVAAPAATRVVEPRGPSTAGESHRPVYPAATAAAGLQQQAQRTAATPERAAYQQEASNQSMGSGQPASAKYHSVHVYGGKAALCFSADETRADKEQTVRVEAAAALGGRRYDWSQKVALQFTTRELPQVLALFMGWIPTLKLQAHGPANDKWAMFANQAGGKVYVTMGQSKNSKAVPIMASDIYQVVDLLIKQILRNSPHMGAEGLLMMVRSLAERYRQEQPAQGGSSP